MDAKNPVGNLCDVQIHSYTCQLQCIGASDIPLFNHEIQHGVERSVGGDIQVFIKAKGQPAGSGRGPGCGDLHVRVKLK